jgi:hypothetical protein
MGKTKRYPVEVRERVVRLVLEHRGEYSSMWAAVTSIAQKFGCSAQTLHTKTTVFVPKSWIIVPLLRSRSRTGAG